jgi:hypothetical protein
MRRDFQREQLRVGWLGASRLGLGHGSQAILEKKKGCRQPFLN